MMRWLLVLVLALTTWVTASGPVVAQELTIATVTRPPFSKQADDGHTGFSISLWAAIAEILDRPYQIKTYDTFPQMLDAVRSGAADAAIANISITAEREKTLDFSHPIFESGLQIQARNEDSAVVALARVLFSREVVLAMLAAFGMLFAGGMLMWALERRTQPYFDRPARQALFPSFWWALNLVVNGGFEERVPRTFLGRIFAVVLVVSSLGLVSVFVAYIAAQITVNAISGSVHSVSDLTDKKVGTVAQSTAAGFLRQRGIRFVAYGTPDEMLRAFDEERLDALVFDAPILAFHLSHGGSYDAHLIHPIFQKEDYGIALPQDSALVEQINQALLQLRENGRYESLRAQWFGSASGE